MSDLAVARQALDRFGLAGRLRRMATGLDTTYRLTTPAGERVAVRVASYPEVRTVPALRTEAAWIHALGAAPVVVPAVRRTVDGDHVAVIGDRGVIALDWLPGTKLRWRFTAAHARAVGAAMAHLHRHASTWRPPGDGWAKSWDERICGAAPPSSALVEVAGDGTPAVVAAVAQRVAAACADLGDVEHHLVNGDIGPHNVVWHDGVPGFFDFNDLGVGYAGFDLARFLHTVRWRDGGTRLVAAALEGYESVAPLPVSWQRHGELFEVATGLFLAGYLAPKVAERGPDTAATVVGLVDAARRLLG